MSEIRAGSFGDLPEDEPYPGLCRRAFDADGATVTRYTFEPRATFPRHRHAQEQITVIEAGSVEFTIGDETKTFAAGSWSVVPGQVEHGITAGPDGATILAIVVPRRSEATPLVVVE
jgi:quercetin dioxygenase-like cupin family protein